MKTTRKIAALIVASALVSGCVGFPERILVNNAVSAAIDRVKEKVR